NAVARWVALAASTSLIACTGDVSDEDPNAEDESSAAVEDASGYVATPAGFYHASCVHEIEDDATVDDDTDIVTRADGSTYQLPPCGYPVRMQPLSADSTEPQVNSWVVDGEKQVTGWVKDVTAEWTVPAQPSNRGSQVIFLFASIENSPRDRIF